MSEGARDTMQVAPRRPREMQLRSWRPVRSATLRGFACVDLPNGLQVADVMVMCQRDGNLFAQLPQRPVVRRNQLVVDQSGRPTYDAPITWQSRELRERFSEKVLELLRAHGYGADLEPEPADAEA